MQSKMMDVNKVEQEKSASMIAVKIRNTTKDFAKLKISKLMRRL